MHLIGSRSDPRRVAVNDGRPGVVPTCVVEDGTRPGWGVGEDQLMKMSRMTAVAALVAAGALAVPTGAYAHSSSKGGPDAVGLAKAGSALVRFDTDRPDKAKKAREIRGLSGDTALVGIDRRVQNGKLYGVGDQGGIYTVSRSSGKATKVGQVSVALQGTSFGVDFNPAANALRIISNTGQNLRQPVGATDGPTSATVVDGTLAYLGVTATGPTTLFDLDTTFDQVAIQSPANAGSLAATGKLGVDTGVDAGFDIFTKLKQGISVGSTRLRRAQRGRAAAPVRRGPADRRRQRLGRAALRRDRPGRRPGPLTVRAPASGALPCRAPDARPVRRGREAGRIST